MSFNKNGIIASSYNPITEPDGSRWVQVFHHNNPSANLFSSSDSFSVGVYRNPNLWMDFSICRKMTSWEFIYKQKVTASSEYVKYRWIQNVSPFGTSYAAVAPSAVTRITTSGYTDGGFGGLYVFSGNTYMVVANSNNDNWYGATGCWTAYDGGIPGYPNTTVTTGDIAIYVRVDNTTYTNPSDFSFQEISGLPSWYRYCEFIKSTGTQYINTGYCLGVNSQLSCRYSPHGS